MSNEKKSQTLGFCEPEAQHGPTILEVLEDICFIDVRMILLFGTVWSENFYLYVQEMHDWVKSEV